MKIYTVGSTIYHVFNTRDADSVPITFAGSPTIGVRKDNGTSTNNSGLTLVVDSGSVTGLHSLTIDTSQDTDFYVTDHEYFAIVTAGTVDSTSVVGETVLEFKLGEVPSNVKKWNSSTLPDVATQSDITGLNNISSGDVETAVGTALASYDPPTKAELDNAVSPLATTSDVTTAHSTTDGLINGLNDISVSDVTSALNTYDSPTKAELDSAVASLATSSALATIDVNIDSILEDTGTTIPALISGMFSGSGANSWTYTLTDADTGLPIGSATVWVTTDADGANIIASGTTDAYGEVTFALDSGNIYVWRYKVGYNFTNPDTEVVP